MVQLIKKLLLLCSILLLSNFLLIAQSTALSEPYIQNMAITLWRTAGQSSLPPTVYFLDPSDYDEIAFADYKVVGNDQIPFIGINKGFISTLEIQLGNNADDGLAFVLGHEIIHLIYHEKGSLFGQSTMPTTSDIELRADREGLLLAYFAGYGAAFNIFDAVFEASPLLNSNQNGYPSHEKRVLINNQLLEEAKEISTIYHVANLLAMTGREGLSFTNMAYATVTKRFASFDELEFNRGLAYLQLAKLQSKVPYNFPLNFFNPQTAFPHRGGNYERPEEETVTLAKQFFEKAVQEKQTLLEFNSPARFKARANAFFSAELGLICLDILDKKYRSAMTKLGDLEKDTAYFPSVKRQEQVDIIRAINTYLKSNETDIKAEEMLVILKTSQHWGWLADYNLKIMRNQLSSQGFFVDLSKFPKPNLIQQSSVTLESTEGLYTLNYDVSKDIYQMVYPSEYGSIHIQTISKDDLPPMDQPVGLQNKSGSYSLLYIAKGWRRFVVSYHPDENTKINYLITFPN